MHLSVNPSARNNNAKINENDSESSSDNDSEKDSEISSDDDNSNNNNNNTDNNTDNNNWFVVNEVGDGACLLRCMARKVHGDPDKHFVTRQQILQHIRDHLHDPIPLFGMSFDHVISGGILSESVAARGQPDTLFDSVGHYLNLMCNAYAYGTHVEIFAATHLFNIDISVTYLCRYILSKLAPPNQIRAMPCTIPSRSTAAHSPVLRLNAKLVQ